MIKKRLWLVVAGLILDRTLKILALNQVILIKKNAGLLLIKLAQPWIIVLTGVVIAWLVYILIKRWQFESKEMIFEYLLIIAGGLSNLFDRLVYGYVIDMINFFSWSVYNLADVMILTGTGLIVLKMCRSSYKS